MKAGVFGGTFDPVHIGHLIIAEQARCNLMLDKVIFIPAGQPWMKADRSITPAEHRLAMLRLALQGNACFEVSCIELNRIGPTYTVDTLEQLWSELGNDSRIYLLLGWDSLAELPKWKAPLRISKMAIPVAFPRPGFEKPDLLSLEKDIPGISQRLVMMDEPYIGISSTGIRQNVYTGKSIRYLVPDAVAKYIGENKLYLG